MHLGRRWAGTRVRRQAKLGPLLETNPVHPSAMSSDCCWECSVATWETSSVFRWERPGAVLGALPAGGMSLVLLDEAPPHPPPLATGSLGGVSWGSCWACRLASSREQHSAMLGVELGPALGDRLSSTREELGPALWHELGPEPGETLGEELGPELLRHWRGARTESSKS
jgi:hypothetical protein